MLCYLVIDKRGADTEAGLYLMLIGSLAMAVGSILNVLGIATQPVSMPTARPPAASARPAGAATPAGAHRPRPRPVHAAPPPPPAARRRRRRRPRAAAATAATSQVALTGPSAATGRDFRALDDLHHQLAGLGRVQARPDAGRAQGVHLALGGALAARHDGAGVAHLLARRGGDAGDVGRHRLRSCWP